MVPADGFTGPYLKSDGPIDLICGGCLAPICEALHPGQIQNFVFMCPRCRAYNAILSIPALEKFVAQVQASPPALDHLPDLARLLQEAQEKKTSFKEVIAQVEHELPDLGVVRDLLIPKNSGDFYGLLSAVIAFVAWHDQRKKSRQKPSVIVNNYFHVTDPFSGSGPNSLCPCGSGKKFKKCHGKTTTV